MRTRTSLLALGGAAVLMALASFPARADEKGEAVLKEAFKTLHAAKSFTATLTISLDQPGAPDPFLKGTVAALKPNFLMVDLKGPTPMLFVADGRNYYSYRDRGESGKTYTKADLPAAPTEFLGQWEGEIDAFFGGPKNVDRAVVSYVGTEKVAGVDCDVVSAKPKPGVVGAEVTYSIGQKDHVIRRSVLKLEAPGISVKQTNNVSDVKLGATKKASDFSFKPPEGAKEVKPPAR